MLTNKDHWLKEISVMKIKRSWSHPKQNTTKNLQVMSIKTIKWPTAAWRPPLLSSGHTAFVPYAKPYNTKQLDSVFM